MAANAWSAGEGSPPIVLRRAADAFTSADPSAPEPLDDNYYRVAGQAICSDVRIPSLEPFSIPPEEASSGCCPRPDRHAPALPALHELASLPVRFHDEVWLAHAHRRLIARESDDWTVLSTASCASVAIARSGGWIWRLDDPVSEDGLLDALVVGPALILALAARGIFCFHASAVSVGGQVRVFLGHSGVGKSTLVADLSACRGHPCTRLADDILPWSCRGGTARALPDYPQLKLAVAAQQVGPAAQPQRFDQIVVLTHESPVRDQVERTMMSVTEGTLALVRHTVAAKLFWPTLLDRHFDACAMLCERIPVAAVAFERDLSRLDDLRRALID